MFRYVSDFPQHPQEWVKKTYILNKEDYRKGVGLVQHDKHFISRESIRLRSCSRHYRNRYITVCNSSAFGFILGRKKSWTCGCFLCLLIAAFPYRFVSTLMVFLLKPRVFYHFSLQGNPLIGIKDPSQPLTAASGDVRDPWAFMTHLTATRYAYETLLSSPFNRGREG